MAGIPNPLEAVPLDRLRTRSSMKWRQYPADVLPLWVAEMDVELAEPVIEAIVEAARSGDTGYAVAERYVAALAGFARRRWGWSDFPVERTALVADVMVGVVEALRLVTGPGDPVIVNPPVYPPFYAFIEHAERTVVDAPLGADGCLDLAVLEQAFARARAGGRPAVYLLCNPHNPTGRVHSRAELAQVATLAERHGVRVIVDEIHGPLVLAGARFVPYLTVAGDSDAFVLTSASKGWNLAGLKAAVLIAGAGAAGDLARLPEIVSHGPTHVGVLAHSAALEHGEPWLDALLAGLDRNRALLADLLADRLPSITWRPPEATFLAWLDCAGAGLPDGGPAATGGRGDVTFTGGPAGVFLDRGRVALTAGAAFGPGGEQHVRLNFATGQDVLRDAIRRMATVAGGR